MRALSILLLATMASAVTGDVPLIQPKDLVAQLAANGAKPAIFQVGPNVLYRSKHIPGSLFAGPGSKPEGIDLLKSAVKNLPKDREIVLYCGCCPWDRCPNISPALGMLKKMGYQHVRALYLPEYFKTDWIDHGYSVE